MNFSFQVGGREIGKGKPVFVIAEVGINHAGSETAAARMIEASALAGADAVKLQTVNVEESYYPGTPSYEEFKGKELSLEALLRLAKVAEENGVILFSTPGDFSSLSLMLDAGMPLIKISSGLMTNMPLLRRAAKTGVPLIISTGMAHFHEVMESVEIVRSSGAEDVAVLHCTSLYPAPPETLNLRVIPELEKKLDCPIGYSDHFDGKLASVAAVAAGAVIIEKHFTLDRTKAGEDHAISLEPSAFKEMVADIRGVEKMLGSSEKTPHPIEVENRAALHRRITAYRDIERGEVITEEDLLMMRLPPDLSGIRANQIDEIVGAKAARPIAKLRGLSLEDVEERS